MWIYFTCNTWHHYHIGGVLSTYDFYLHNQVFFQFPRCPLLLQIQVAFPHQRWIFMLPAISQCCTLCRHHMQWLSWKKQRCVRQRMFNFEAGRKRVCSPGIKSSRSFVTLAIKQKGRKLDDEKSRLNWATIRRFLTGSVLLQRCFKNLVLTQREVTLLLAQLKRLQRSRSTTTTSLLTWREKKKYASGRRCVCKAFGGDWMDRCHRVDFKIVRGSRVYHLLWRKGKSARVINNKHFSEGHKANRVTGVKSKLI